MMMIVIIFSLTFFWGVVVLILIFYSFQQSKEECEYLIDLATPHMAKSTVVDSKTGKSKDSRFAFPILPPLILL